MQRLTIYQGFPLRHLAFVALLAPTLCFAQITDPEQTFSLLCVSDQGTGFNWENGEWRQRNYAPNSYVFRKHKLSDCVGRPQNDHACYSFTLVGEDTSPTFCREYWRLFHSVQEVERVVCDKFINFEVGVPLKRFVVTSTYPVFATNDDLKDYVYVMMGKCSEIE